MKPLFLVAKTFDVITEESASEGDFAETGYVYEETRMTLKEVLDEVNSLGSFETNGCGDSLSLYGVDPDIDYYDGSETRECLHIDASERVIRRLSRLIKNGRKIGNRWVA